MSLKELLLDFAAGFNKVNSVESGLFKLLKLGQKQVKWGFAFALGRLR